MCHPFRESATALSDICLGKIGHALPKGKCHVLHRQSTRAMFEQELSPKCQLSFFKRPMFLASV